MILIEILFYNPLPHTPFNAFANITDPYQAALARATWSGSTLFAYGNMIGYDPKLVDLINNFFVLCTKVKVKLNNYSLWMELSMNIHKELIPFAF